MKPPSASFVSTLRPAATQRRAALGVAAVSVVVFALVAPFAKQPIPPLPAFLPLYQAALVVFDLITGVLLLGQYRMLRSRALLLLAAGYAFSAAMATAHLLSFPGLFGPGGAIGGGTQSTAWLYFLWHAGFPLFIVGYAVSKPQEQRLPVGSSTTGLASIISLGGGTAAAMILISTATHDWLPPIMTGNWDAPGKLVVAAATWLIGIAALAIVWRRRPHTVLDLWLMVALCVWTADTALAAVLNGARFDLGWYAGRIYGLLANGFVLVVLLLENGTLYARLAEVNRVLAEKNGELADASRLKSEFVANMSHELRTPLNAIIGFSEVLKEGVVGELKDEQHSYVCDIHSSGQHLLALINDILDLSKIEAGRMTLDLEPVEVRPLFEQGISIVRERAREKGLRLEVDVDPRCDTLLLDSRKTKQILYNLLSNAVKFSRPGGRVSLRVRPADARDVKGWSATGATAVRMSLPKDPTGHFLEILVQDEGIGIAPEDAGRLFTMFSQVDSSITREVEGTGLGLALVDQLARLAGGTVALSSTPDEGASFYVWLPWRDSPVPEEEAKSAVPSSSSSRAQPVTLVIEDNDLAAQLIRIQLEEEGFRVNRVATARAALVWMSEGAPDLIILDLVLPDMDGWDLLVQLKGPKSPVAHVPVVIVSIVADAPRGIALGAAAAVTKPYLRDELLAALNEAGFATGAQEEGRLVAEVHRALELAP